MTITGAVCRLRTAIVDETGLLKEDAIFDRDRGGSVSTTCTGLSCAATGKAHRRPLPLWHGRDGARQPACQMISHVPDAVRTAAFLLALARAYDPGSRDNAALLTFLKTPGLIMRGCSRARLRRFARRRHTRVISSRLRST